MIPEALCKSGEIVINAGTCKGCNDDANARYESLALHADFNTARILLGLKRKRRSVSKRKPLTLPPVASGDRVMGGNDFDVHLSADEYPNQISLIMFAPAGKLIGENRNGDLDSFRLMVFRIGPKPHETQGVTTREGHNHTAFALTLAKIAYCFAAAELGLANFNGTDIRALLRGERVDVYNFVGGLSVPQHLTNRYLHKLYLKRRGNLVTVIVHLFASCGMGAYEVVIN